MKRIAMILIGGLMPFGGAMGAILDGDERQRKIDAAVNILGREVKQVAPETIKEIGNPLVVKVGKSEEMARGAGLVARSPEELLPLLAQRVKPTGAFAVNGDYYLMFTEKKLRAGSEVSVDFQSKEYKLTITNITHRDYTLRLGDAEIQLKLK